MNFRLPGFGKPPSVPAVTPAPTRDDPSIEDAKKKLRMSERQRSGRMASVLTPSEDDLGVPNVDRATALDGTVRRGAQNLGG